MRNLKSRLGVIEKERQNLIPPEPVKIFFDPAEHAEYEAAHPDAMTILVEFVDASKKIKEVAP